MPTNPQEDEELRNKIVDLLIEYKAADQEGRLSVYKRIIDLIHSRDKPSSNNKSKWKLILYLAQPAYATVDDGYGSDIMLFDTLDEAERYGQSKGVMYEAVEVKEKNNVHKSN